MGLKLIMNIIFHHVKIFQDSCQDT